MKAAIYCPDPETPAFDTAGFIVCSGGSSPTFEVDSSLGLLDAADLALLMSALLGAVALAAAFNVVYKMFGWR